MSNRQSRTEQNSSRYPHSPYGYGETPRFPSSSGETLISRPQSYPARSSSQLYTPLPHGSNQTGAPLNRALPFSSPTPAQTQSQPHQRAQHIYARPVSHQVLPSVPQHSHTQLPQPFQRTQNRDSKAFSSNVQPYQTQSSQSAGATSTQAFQQDFISNTIRPTSNFRNCIQDVYIAVMGITGSGKSTFVGICSEKNAPVGHDLESSQLIHLSHSELAH